jgi:hypothetical protein
MLVPNMFAPNTLEFLKLGLNMFVSGMLSKVVKNGRLSKMVKNIVWMFAFVVRTSAPIRSYSTDAVLLVCPVETCPYRWQKPVRMD